MGVGGSIRSFVLGYRDEVIEAVRDADVQGLPLCVIGGGSNLLVRDGPFDGVVVRDRSRGLHDVLRTDDVVVQRVDAGMMWDDYVAMSVGSGLSGVEGLSGVPGTVGASVVQNIGAYGQSVASSVRRVEAWDRLSGRLVVLGPGDLRFGYRTSALKESMYVSPAVPAVRFFPTPRYVVLTVDLALRPDGMGTVAYGQLAHALGAVVGDRLPVEEIRAAVLRVRAAKGMLEDPHRYATPVMAGMRDPIAVEAALESMRRDSDVQDADRHSCGSFFMNPVLSVGQAAQLPDDAPRFPVAPQGAADVDARPGVKTSAAWLIDHAGFHRGFRLSPDAPAALSSRHTLALTNRGAARAADVVALASAVRDGVRSVFGVTLDPEPVLVGVGLD
ncbi:FAD-binding protein [uncultured Bifidobacterium sp.]|uniref:FAD-binding protein n=1 Tax=uncultured Bifidobacterium sp. TaxID=165187 RepID=UPI0028DCD891|nr:FAD-binding protein [uncultured Bifidobacterium sp.]